MNDRVIIPIEASLLNPDDPAEVTLVVDAVSLGTTLPLASGHVVTWDEAAMRAFADSFAGTPVNVLLSASGEATDHSDNVVGVVKNAVFDEASKKIRVFASLWRHYFPETVDTLKTLFKDKKLQASMEFLASKLRSNPDGTVTPEQGRFGGLGLVATGADLGNSVLLMASALKADTKESEKVPEPITTAPVGSYEWVSLQAAEWLANNVVTDSTSASVNGTYTNAIVYTQTSGTSSDTFRINYELTDNKLKFGEPVRVDPTFVPLEASRKDDQEPAISGVQNMPTEQEFTELKASRDALETEVKELRETKTAYETLKASVEAKEKEAAAEKLADSRIEEIEKIKKYENTELKASHRELFKTADDKTFEGFKALIASTVELKGGISSESTAPTDDGSDPVEAKAKENLGTWREEALAHLGVSATK